MSERWKTLERTAAEKLRGRRVQRLLFGYGASMPDVIEIDHFPHVVVECKSRRRFAFHAILEETASKYCQRGETAILVTKSRRQIGEIASMPLNFFADLLDRLRRIERPPGAVSEDATSNPETPTAGTQTPSNEAWKAKA